MIEWKHIKYFKPSEFDCPFEPGSGEIMSCALISKLDVLRHIWGKPLIVTSGYRSKKRNTYLREVKNLPASPVSSHLKGLAVDLRIKSKKELKEFTKLAVYLGFKRIGQYELKNKYWIHLDIDKTKKNAIWFYSNGKYKKPI